MYGPPAFSVRDLEYGPRSSKCTLAAYPTAAICARTLTRPPTPDTSSVAPSWIGPRSGSGAPPRASTSVKPVTNDPDASKPVTVNDTVRAGSASPRAPRSAYGVAVIVYAPSGSQPAL